MELQEVGWCMEVVDLAQERERWRAGMKLRVTQNALIYCLTQKLLASQEGICFMELVMGIVYM